MGNGVTYSGKISDGLLEIQHRCNPLHIYCRLVERGLDKNFSIEVCRNYEEWIYNWFNKCVNIGYKTIKGIENLVSKS